MSFGVGHTCGSDSALLWLWRRPVATAPIRPLAWEPPYAAGVALEKAKRPKKKKKEKKKERKKESRVEVIQGMRAFQEDSTEAKGNKVTSITG